MHLNYMSIYHYQVVTRMSRIVFTIICILSIYTVKAQGGCMYYNERIFVLDIQLPTNWSNSDELKVYLVNEDSIPYNNEPVFINDNAETLKTPKQFELNTEKNAKQRKNPYQQRDYFEPLSQTWYTCTINKNNNVLTRPIYQVMIITRQKKNIDTVVIHLPYERALDICENYLDRTGNQNHELRFSNGEPFFPITINLNNEQPIPAISNPLEAVYFKYNYQLVTQTAGDYIHLTGITVYDKLTLAKIQYIAIDNAIPFAPNQWKQFTQTDDFYADNIQGIKDFRYTTEYIFDSAQNIVHHKFDHYVFNPETVQYEKDQTLSDAYNVRFESKEIFRYQVEFTPETKYYDTYKLNKDNWELTIRRTEQIAPKYVKLRYCVGWDEPILFNKTILFFTENSSYNTYYDTIPFTNYCADTCYTSIQQNTWPAQFSITDTLLPKASGYMALKLPVAFNPTVIELIERSNLVSFNIDNVYPINYTIFTVPPGTAERDSLTGNIVRYISQYDTNSYLIQVLELHKNGMPKGWGACSRNSRIKVMHWRYWDESGKELPGIRYSKELMINILNPERLVENPEVKVKTNGIWVTPEIRKVSSTLIFYLPIETDSLIIVSNDASVEIKLNKWQYENYVALAYFLLPDDEAYINNNGVKTPITWEENEFAIIWDDAFLSSRTPETRDLNISIKRLQKKYPTLLFSVFDQHNYAFTIVLPNLSKAEQKAVLEQLINEPEIGKIAQVLVLPNKDRTFIQGSPYMSLDYNMNYEQINALALKYNCKLNNVAFSGNLYQAIFQDVFLGPAFIKKLNLIATDPQVLSVSSSWYSPPVLDDPYLKPQPLPDNSNE